MSTTGKHSPLAVAKRVLFLAYSSSKAIGMGRLQAVENATEEQVWHAAYNATDYPNSQHTKPRPGLVNADYVLGRQIKLRIEWDRTDLSLSLRDDEALWLATYPTVGDLLEKALKELDS